MGLALFGLGCSKRYTEIEIRDPGRVGVATLGSRGPETALAPDGTPRVVPLAPGVAATRQGHEIAITWEGRRPLALVDEHGLLPRTTPGPGIEFRGRTLWAAYNVTPTRIWPQATQPSGSFPIVLTTDMSNVIDAREVREVRHWPAYVCLPPGLLFTVLGTALLTSQQTASKFGGGFLLAGGIPLVVFSVINLTSSNDVKPLEIPGAAPLH
jgi:hypothetical protein